jgi:hypothetical protein
MMKNTMARYLVLLFVGGSAVGGAALGLAGMANAAESTQPTGPGHSYAPSVKANPANEATPGARNHKGIWHINTLND